MTTVRSKYKFHLWYRWRGKKIYKFILERDVMPLETYRELRVKIAGREYLGFIVWRGDHYKLTVIANEDDELPLEGEAELSDEWVR